MREIIALAVMGVGLYLAVQVALFVRDIAVDQVRTALRCLLHPLFALGAGTRFLGPSQTRPARTVAALALLLFLAAHTAPVVQPAAANVSGPAPSGDSLHRFIDNDKWGYADAQGCPVIPAVYDALKPYSEGLSAVCRHGRWGYIDTRGHTVIPFDYRNANSFKDGAAVVATDISHFVVIDKSNRVLKHIPRPSYR